MSTVFIICSGCGADIRRERVRRRNEERNPDTFTFVDPFFEAADR